MEVNSSIRIKSLGVRVEDDGQARIEAKLQNRARVATQPLILLIYFYDEENRVRDRISIRLAPIAPNETRSVNTVFRLKAQGFFSYTARLEKPA